MTDPLWRGPVELTWDGERLMAGRIVVGQVYQSGDLWWSTLTGRLSGYPRHDWARSACLDAAVRALSGSHNQPAEDGG